MQAMTTISTKGHEKEDSNNKQASIAAQDPRRWKALALLSLAHSS